MANMGYCRFENTAADLFDCYEHIQDEDLSESETRARKKMIELCVDIACDLGSEVDRPCEETELPPL